MSDSAFSCRAVSHRYSADASPALRGVDVEMAAGNLTCIIGPNGAGKSTLVRVLAGTLRPTEGRAEFLGRSLETWPRTDLARRLAVVGQDAPSPIRQAVREYVALGRNPYVSAWSPLSDRDHDVVAWALRRVGLEALSNRDLNELSGGERQRARLARALAQEPDVLILDEPTAHLDVGHGLWAFETLRSLVEGGVTVVCVTHDINLASRFADELILIAGGRVRGLGAASRVLGSEVLSAAYGCSIRVEILEGAGHVILPVSAAPVSAGESGMPGGSPGPGEPRTASPC